MLVAIFEVPVSRKELKLNMLLNDLEEINKVIKKLSTSNCLHCTFLLQEAIQVKQITLIQINELM